MDLIYMHKMRSKVNYIFISLIIELNTYLTILSFRTSNIISLERILAI